MSTFFKQIKEDIKLYQEAFSYIENMKREEWAFNYWVLDKIFKVDEELIESKIIDYRDMGIDAYEVYEDTKEIYLIQNKFYTDKTKLTDDYVKNDFLLRPINALNSGTYTHCDELQNVFNKLKNADEFTVYLQIFITNNLKNKKIEEYIKKFNRENPKYIANIFYLDDIKNKYFEEIIENKTKLSIKIESVNKGTILNINTDSYKLKNILDARYVMTPVVSIYKFYKESAENNYPIFEKNIREFLGNKGINKKIYETLLDESERNNFFYYNNGITLICDSMSSIKSKSSKYNTNAYFEVNNPQIVNGCQTVNSIFEALKNMDETQLEKDYKDTFVMLKILVIDGSVDSDQDLYKKIVTYNNSQNAITEKTFVANMAVFNRMQSEFEKKGLLILIKQSDKNKFSKKYKDNSKFKSKVQDLYGKFNIEYKSINDLYIPLEKLLQIINAFKLGGYIAYVKKSNMLKQGSREYETAIDFIKNDSLTMDALIALYALYKKAEQEKKKSENGRIPIPYYLIDIFAKYECNNRNPELILENLNSSEKIEKIIKLYQTVSNAYIEDYFRDYNLDYNKMIKQPIKYEIIDKYRKILQPVL